MASITVPASVFGDLGELKASRRTTSSGHSVFVGATRSTAVSEVKNQLEGSTGVALI